MNLPFDAWLLVVGLAIGAGLAWLVLADLRRREDDIAAGEMHSEAAWLADSLRSQGIAADAEAVEEVLRLHRAYLAGIPDEAAWAPVESATDDTDRTDDGPPPDRLASPTRDPLGDPETTRPPTPTHASEADPDPDA